MRLLHLLIVYTVISASQTWANPTVHHIGELKAIMMKGESKALITLSEVKKTNLFALGPVEGLKGEITTLDGKPIISQVNTSGEITIHNSWDTKAALLVYANVAKWSEKEIPNSIQSLQDLEMYVETAAQKAGLDIEKPFLFQVKGKFSEAEFHIVKGVSKDHQHGKSSNAAFFTDKNSDGTLMGFFSKHDQGVFTHMGSNIHVHYISADEKHSGHLERVNIDKSAKLMLPN